MELPVARNYVAGQGPADARMMFVGEAPGAIEDNCGIPFSGPSGDLLWDICREIGLDRREVYVTNVCKYRPPSNDMRRLKEIGVDIDEQISQLWDEIQAINPNVIVALGNTPLRALTKKDKILRWRGSILKSCHLDYKVVACLHPAALLHSEDEGGGDEDRFKGKKKGPLKYSYRHILKLDLLRALEERESRLYEVPERVLEVARDSVQLQRFLDLYKGKDTVSVDIEVVKSIPFCIGLAFNNWHAVSVPLIDVFSWQNLGGVHDHHLAEMWRLVDELLRSGIKVIGQNFKFDQGQLQRLCGIRIANFHCDTSLLAHALHPEFPKALEFTTSVYTREPYYKEEGREFDWKKDKVDRYLLYNARDAAVTFEVYEQMMKDARELIVPGFPNWVDEFVYGHQMALHPFYCELDSVGFHLNQEKQKVFVKLYDEKAKEANDELNKIAGWEVNVNSRKQMAVLVYNQLKYPQRKGTGEDVLVALMANTKKQAPSSKRALELILLIRRLNIAKTKIGRKPDYDGRMRTVFTICGTETGRSSTKIMKPPVRPEKMGLEFHTLTKHGEIGTEVREMLETDDGYVIVETDMSQAEARIVALFARDSKLLQLFADKADIHKLTASWIFGIPVTDITKELRFIGKTTRHAGNYDMGKHRLMELVNTEAKRQGLEVNLSEFRAGKILDAFHNFSPNIRGVFHKEIQQALQDNNRVLVNPFGRYRQFFDRWGRELFKEAYAQLPQSTVPDHLRRAGIRAKIRFEAQQIDARFVVEAHDALVGLVKREHVQAYASILHEEIERPIDFSRCTIQRGTLIIPAESKIGTDYKNLKDFHLEMAA
jgi:uracil-DNA glycosylase family 4